MSATARQILTVGTRASKLALWQSNHVIELLTTAWPALECRTKTYMTDGDTTRDVPLPEIGTKGVFTTNLERAINRGEIELAVHSLKDLPVEEAPGLTIGAIPRRADARDVLVARNGWTLATLPKAAVVGTSSIRREAQLLAARRDLTIKPIRGNVDTRVRKVMEGEFDAIILAAAGLQRLNLAARVTEWLPLDVMLPAPGQGALAVQCRADDTATLTLLAAIEDPVVRAEVTAERTFLEELGGGCSLPVAAFAVTADKPISSSLQMSTVVIAPNGRNFVRVNGDGDDARRLGIRLARQAVRQGAGKILSRLASPPAVRPLRSKRIVVTRARHQGREFCERLSQLGATPVLLPAIRIAPMPDTERLDLTIQSLEHYDWLVFTSTNGVNMFWRRFEANGLPRRAFDAVRVAAVGPATAQLLKERGVQPDFVPDEFVGEKIADGMGDVAGLKIALLRAEIARGNLIQKLTLKGAVVDNIPIYRTLPEDIDAQGWTELKKGVDAITFTSGSTVRNFVLAVTKHDQSLSFLKDILIACIGPLTADAAREIGLKVGVVATEYTTDGLIDALLEYF